MEFNAGQFSSNGEISYRTSDPTERPNWTFSSHAFSVGTFYFPIDYFDYHHTVSVSVSICDFHKVDVYCDRFHTGHSHVWISLAINFQVELTGIGF